MYVGAIHCYPYIHFTGSPNCPTVNATVNNTSVAVSIHKSLLRWLPEQYYVEVSYYENESLAIAYNSTLKDPASFDITPLQADTVYNISVIPCNVAGCNESCGIHLVQTAADKEGEIDLMYTSACQWCLYNMRLCYVPI